MPLTLIALNGVCALASGAVIGFGIVVVIALTIIPLTGCGYFDPVTAAKFAYKDAVYPIERSPAYHATPTPAPR